jgi:HEAT repeat protein
MSVSPTTNELLEQLATALRGTWPEGWRWLRRPSSADYDRSVAEAQDALDAVRARGDWRAIPTLLYVLTHDNESLRTAAAAVVAHLEGVIPISALPGFEVRLRQSTLQAYAWNKLGVREVVKRTWPPGVLAMFTLHPNGYVREKALRRMVRIGETELSLRYLLLRLNDWVRQVREFAAVEVQDLISIEHALHWVPVLGLIDQLRHRTRVENSWLSERLTALFLRPDARAQLMSAVMADDRAVARWAYSTALSLPAADSTAIAWLALKSPDSLVRLRAAACVRRWNDGPDREELLGKMTVDRFMPVRREALYAMLDAPTEPRRAFLVSSLLDRHRSMREAARYYLRQDTERAGESFDFRGFYLPALANDVTSALAIAISGLGECGHPSDAVTLMHYVSDPRPSVAAAAVRAVATLDRGRRVSWFLGLLSDERPAVARVSSCALGACDDAESVAKLRETFQKGEHTHSRRFALRLLLRRRLFDEVVDAIVAAGGDDAILAHEGLEFIEGAVPGRVPYGPSDAQRAAVVNALATLSRPLSERTLKRVREITGVSIP